MDLLEGLQTRRSIKGFSSEPLARDTLLELVELARYTPSGGNKNPWQFILVTEKETIERLSQTHPYCRWLASAQWAIAIVVNPNMTRYWLEDCCLAAYTIWLAATARDIGVAWAAMHQSDSAEESEHRQGLVRQLLDIPERYKVPIVLGLGHPEKAPGPRQLVPLEKIIFWESYTA
ncbi:MAG: nitroreductase family protein [Chloroflexi bacterium]|nr:nitroreductase family protein [Chloroflexota bacterium]